MPIVTNSGNINGGSPWTWVTGTGVFDAEYTQNNIFNVGSLSQEFGLQNLTAGPSLLAFNPGKGASYFQTKQTGSQSTLIQAEANLVKLRVTLAAQLAALSGEAPNSVGDPNSLYEQAKVVYNDLLKSFTKSDNSPVQADTPFSLASTGLQNWLLDGYQSNAASGGLYQQHINFALTAATSLNSQQQQNVSNFLYVFEEFEKSAAAILQQLTQIIENIAQNIAR